MYVLFTQTGVAMIKGLLGQAGVTTSTATTTGTTTGTTTTTTTTGTTSTGRGGGGGKLTSVTNKTISSGIYAG